MVCAPVVLNYRRGEVHFMQDSSGTATLTKLPSYSYHDIQQEYSVFSHEYPKARAAWGRMHFETICRHLVPIKAAARGAPYAGRCSQEVETPTRRDAGGETEVNRCGAFASKSARRSYPVSTITPSAFFPHLRAHYPPLHQASRTPCI